MSDKAKGKKGKKEEKGKEEVKEKVEGKKEEGAQEEGEVKGIQNLGPQDLQIGEDLLDNVMYKVKNKNEKCLDISFNGILKYLIKEKKNDEKEKAAKKEKEEKKKEKEEKKKEDDEREKRERKEQKEKKIKELYDIIPKSEIYFPKNLQLGEELEKIKTGL